MNPKSNTKGLAIFATALLPYTAALLWATPAHAASAFEVEFSGEMLHTIRVDAEKGSGLECVYVAYDTKGMGISYRASSADAKVVWRRFSNLGGGYAEDIEDVVYESDGVSRLSSLQGDMGYIVEEDGRQYCFWVVEYLPHRFTLESVAPSAEPDCSASVLQVEGHGAPIYYYSVTGRQCTLSRDITVSYDTQEWNDSDKIYEKYAAQKTLPFISGNVYISPAAYTHTSFRLSGDRFLREWRWEVAEESAVVAPVAVACHTEAVQEGMESGSEGEDASPSSAGSNIIGAGKGEGLGGSAPAHITFTAYVTDGVLHDEWQMSRDQSFETVEYRFNERVLDYTFNEEGTFYLRYVGSNADGTCETYSDTYTVSIGASALLCPNAFSPDGDGVNDIWKVAYRSLISFSCQIFSRQGQEVCSFSDPSAGWDGTISGKSAPSGVYYYVIQAVGADGKKYNLSGDINILKKNVKTTK